MKAEDMPSGLVGFVCCAGYGVHSENCPRVLLHAAQRDLAAQTALVERAVETLRAIEGGHDGRLTPLALAGDWHGFTNILQDIARAFLSEIRERKE